MGLFDFFKKLFGGESGPVLPPPDVGRSLDELALRLELPTAALRDMPINYARHTIPKRSGGQRVIHAPSAELKAVQRAILRRVLGGRVHPAAMGFERGKSIATHALLHAFSPVVVSMDIRDFFASTRADRIHAYFRFIGWNDDATQVLTRLCTHEGGLPQGAPTSPKLSNLVNYRLDARLTGFAQAPQRFMNPKTMKWEYTTTAPFRYSRYADDLTFSFELNCHDLINSAIHAIGVIVRDEGYKLHTRKKLRIMRRHDRQQVTGLVVNDGVRLPRKTRRLLRAVEHHLTTGRPATMDEAQLRGWYALQHMVDSQTGLKPEA